MQGFSPDIKFSEQPPNHPLDGKNVLYIITPHLFV
jgi:hypothetical protein